MKKIISIFLTIAVGLGGFFSVQRLLVPKYTKGIVEGTLIEEYYPEAKNHDVIIIGDCEVYENISPITMWEEYGITSFIRGSAQQLIWQSYYLLEETLKYEKPEVVVFNVLALKYDQPQKEEYNRLTLDGMKFSATKLKAVNASMMPDENVLSYIFPLFRYHSRWSEVNSEDFENFFGKRQMFHNGYYMRADVKPVETVPSGRILPDYDFGDNAYKYLNMMVELCEENDIELVLIKAPSLYPYWYDEWEQQMEDYSRKKGLKYINYLELVDEIDLDFAVDTYDAGLHLNVTGAEKVAMHLGKVLSEEFDIEDRRSNQQIAAIWEKKVEFYNEMKKNQYEELEQYGYIKSLKGE
ncbi:SGNH/GDSL hydrolase family protein [Alkalibacter mobilis]|uniref:SGNH/GDSL hydrolase family protein n=1 Tax=Alkalibacter mobilis TaxID=2787712 RepID=UPI00189D4FD1|nr:SGNH/GDSL hydrolase family protein [Alkalibacter mobilis]MBF7097030.1 SGNH/GDSL hydrolase family protein [Alkalibacter mobilis]